MGCLSGLICPKRRMVEIESEPIKNTPYEMLTTKENEDNNRDLKDKRELAEYLVKNDFNRIKSLLEVVKELDDESFNQMFEGNTEFSNFNVPPEQKKSFLELVAKFEHNKELIFEYYNQKDYYSIVLQIWKANILFVLKKNCGNREEQEKILKGARINMNDWDNNFQIFFN